MYDNSAFKPWTLEVKTSGGSRSNSEEDKEGWWVIILIQTASLGTEIYRKIYLTFYLELSGWNCVGSVCLKKRKRLLDIIDTFEFNV